MADLPTPPSPPTPEEATPTGEGATPQPEGATQQPVEATRTPEEAVPQPAAATPQPEGATPQPDQIPVAATPAPAAQPHPASRTRTSGVWAGVVIAAVVLTLLLVFILQNMKVVKISFFTASGHMPLGVALLLNAIGGVLLAAVAGSLRIWQLRRRLNDSGRPGARKRRTPHRAAEKPPG